jgi:hypothetical protein
MDPLITPPRRKIAMEASPDYIHNISAYTKLKSNTKNIILYKKEGAFFIYNHHFYSAIMV